MTLSPRLRRFVLTAHVASSVGWLGAVVAFLPLAVAGLVAREVQTVRSAYLAMELIGWYALVPLAFLSLTTGIVHSLGTQWGLFRHYWVLIKFGVTVLSTIILLSYMQTLGLMAAVAGQPTWSSTDVELLRRPSAGLHAGLALLALLANTTLSVYKPQGLTPYGRRKEEPRRGATYPTPRWVGLLGILALVSLLLLAIGLLVSHGGHGPARHGF